MTPYAYYLPALRRIRHALHDIRDRGIRSWAAIQYKFLENRLRDQCPTEADIANLELHMTDEDRARGQPAAA
ncbi:hypothetical protein CcrSwift_gp033 [Caulobacter phage CcrSwift]|uniref:Uncharacterized protein n=1 Tax=Caulobacter phage CcrSwift TaxID=2927984 RepID=K4JTD2_9CAUD|nr:hypothetical protein D870_gp033 [Caulobacter phage CcrSwift]AFU88351.1 hypothetical protein CcrSwift_gp033 [Caulobacter phage CcrSwift]